MGSGCRAPLGHSQVTREMVVVSAPLGGAGGEWPPCGLVGGPASTLFLVPPPPPAPAVSSASGRPGAPLSPPSPLPRAGLKWGRAGVGPGGGPEVYARPG